MVHVPPPVTPLRAHLHRFYECAELLTGDGKDCPSYSRCSSSCRLEGRQLTPPTGAYVGEEYGRGVRMLFVGINTNQASQSSEKFYQSYNFISAHSTETSQGIDGAVHRIARKLLCKSDATPEETCRFFAFSNLIKCSVNNKSGKPTQVMCDQCGIRLSHLFAEIAILKPHLIIALGVDPFRAVRNHYIQTINEISPFGQWAFSFNLETSRVMVLFAYNPGNGYRGPRGEWKKIQAEEHLRDKWQKFLPEGVSSGDDLKCYLAREYPDSRKLVDIANPFYDLVLDKLIAVTMQTPRQ